MLPLTNSEFYRKRAEEVEQLAGAIRFEHEREAMLKIAEQWRRRGSCTTSHLAADSVRFGVGGRLKPALRRSRLSFAPALRPEAQNHIAADR